MNRAKTFYEQVLQKWSWIDLSGVGEGNQDMQMFAFPWDNEGIWAAGALVKMKGYTPSNFGTIVYFSCDDCSVEESRVETNGGKVCKSKTTIGEFGFISIIQDTEWNTIGLHSMK